MTAKRKASPFDGLMPEPFDPASVPIDVGIPMPRKKSKSAWRALFERMEVGESAEVPANLRGSAACAAQRHGQRTGTKFEWRAIDERTARVWRIK